MVNGWWCEIRGAESSPLIRYIAVADGDEFNLFALRSVVRRNFPPAYVAGLSQTFWMQTKLDLEVVPKLLCQQSCPIQEVRYHSDTRARYPFSIKLMLSLVGFILILLV